MTTAANASEANMFFKSSTARWRVFPSAVLAMSLHLLGCDSSHDNSATTPSDRERTAALQAVVDSAVASERHRIPGAALYVRSGNDTFDVASGARDLDTGAELQPTASFRAGSVLKMFVATVILQLWEQEKLSLDASLDELLPASTAALLDGFDSITVRMLLSHTSGIADSFADNDAILAQPRFIWKAEDVVAAAAAEGPLFEAGAKWSYSNTNYVLLGLVIEHLTKATWRDAVRERIFEPLKLAHTSLPEPGDVTMPAGAAHGYIDTGDRDMLDVTEIDPSMAGAAGGSALVTTTADLARFLDSLLEGQLFSSPQTLEAMLPSVPAEDGSGFPHYYGFGMEKYVMSDGTELVGHMGTAGGYVSAVYRISGAQTHTVAAMVNNFDPLSLYEEVIFPALESL